MRVSYFTQIVAIVGFIAGNMVTYYSGSNTKVRFVGLALTVGSLVWYFWKGHRLRGWMGRPIEEMVREEKLIDQFLETRADKNGKALSDVEIANLMKRQKRLQEELRQYSLHRDGF